MFSNGQWHSDRNSGIGVLGIAFVSLPRPDGNMGIADRPYKYKRQLGLGATVLGLGLFHIISCNLACTKYAGFWRSWCLKDVMSLAASFTYAHNIICRSL